MFNIRIVFLFVLYFAMSNKQCMLKCSDKINYYKQVALLIILRCTKQNIMNNLRNKVQLIGNLGQAPEIISFDNGNKLAKFTIATNESYKNAKGEKITDTQWHNVVAWGKVAEIIEQYVEKGQEIALEGKIVNSNYENKEGEKRYRTEVQVSELLLLGSKK